MGVYSSLGCGTHKMRPCQENPWHTVLHTLGSQRLVSEFRNIMNSCGMWFTEAFISSFFGENMFVYFQLLN